MERVKEPQPDDQANAPSASITAVVVATDEVLHDDVARVVEACRAEAANVVVARISAADGGANGGASGGASGASDWGMAPTVNGATPSEAILHAARIAPSARCVIVDARRQFVPGSVGCFAGSPSDSIASAARCSPVDHDMPAGPVAAALLRHWPFSLPTHLVAGGDVLVALDDVGAMFRSLDRLDAERISFTVAPSPIGDVDDLWSVADVERFARDAVDVFRAAPESLPASGLGRYRSVSYATHLRRRLALLRRPRSSTPAATAFWRSVREETSRAEWEGLTAATTILMYHGFVDGSGSRYVVDRRRLRQQLRLLRWTRRRVISLDDYVDMRRGRGYVASRSVVVTIDDGYADTYTVAAPEFRRAGAIATLFVPTDHVGGVCDWSTDAGLAGRRLASWEQIASGADTIAVGSHACHHVPLNELDDASIDDELVGSADELQRRLGHPITAFAYPYGADSAQTRRRVEQSGYVVACTSHGGRNAVAEPLHSLRRVEVRGDASLWGFVVAVFTGSTVPLHRQIRGAR